MTEIYVERRGQYLVPISSHFAEELDALPHGVPFKAKLTRPRTLPSNGLYWSCLGAMAKAGAATSRDDIHDATKVKCGIVRFARTPDGEFFAFPDSTAFSRMDQGAFNDYFNRAIAYWKSSKLWDYLPPDLRDKLEAGER